jgi:hypothetical protein
MVPSPNGKHLAWSINEKSTRRIILDGIGCAAFRGDEINFGFTTDNSQVISAGYDFELKQYVLNIGAQNYPIAGMPYRLYRVSSFTPFSTDWLFDDSPTQFHFFVLKDNALFRVTASAPR